MTFVVVDERSEARFGLVRHCDEAVVKPFSMGVSDKSCLPVYDDCIVERSLAPLVNGYRDLASP